MDVVGSHCVLTCLLSNCLGGKISLTWPGLPGLHVFRSHCAWALPRMVAALLIFCISTDQFPNFLHLQGAWSFFSHVGAECKGYKSLNSFLWEVKRGLKHLNGGILSAHAWA